MNQAVPLFLNAEASNSPAFADLLRDNARVDLQIVEGALLTERIRRAAEAGTGRIIIAGGDGSIAAGAQGVAGTETVLGVIPLGTLNHFAKDFNIPLDAEEALEVALGDSVHDVDVGYLNGRMFINTSSVGGYVKYVRIRRRHRRRLGYLLSSFIAGCGVLARLPSFEVVLQIEGTERRYVTPLVFVGVGERETRLPDLGSRRKNGRRGLHVLIVKGKTRGRLFTFAFAAAAHGIRRISRTPHADAFLVRECTVNLRAREASAAVDGEVEPFKNPLRYRLESGLIRVAMPAGPPVRNGSQQPST